jgi:hypothetical protein
MDERSESGMQCQILNLAIELKLFYEDSLGSDNSRDR